MIDEARTVRPGEQLDTERLAAFLLQQLPDAAGPLVIEQFPSGFSNLTYLLRLGERQLVLRRPPFGAAIKSGHDMAREYRILQALRPVYPKAPAPLLYSDDLSIIGAPFYVMERVSGVILRNRLPPGLSLSPGQMTALCHALIDNLAALHRLDLRATGLADLGRPEGYVQRQVNGWITRYENAMTDDVPAMTGAAAWLRAHLPPDQGAAGAALIHNDYKFDNVVLDPDDLTHIRAVLDWEMATVGDPWMDVGTTLGYWAEVGDPELLRNFGITALPGNLTRQQFVDAYAAASGREATHALFYLVFGLFKVAVIVQQIYARYRQGHTQDPRFAGLIHLVRANGEMMTQAIETQRLSGLFG
jgi:aminoglycoside phosphotransferase (APT) family kinase protein